MKKTILVTVRNHFDLMWRRPFRVPMQDKGLEYAPYARLQELYIERNLAFCAQDPEYRFTVESVAVLREYLRRNPEREEQIRRLMQDKRLYVPASGDNIVDGNLISGESLLQNFVQGQRWLNGFSGAVPAMAVRTDAFGNSAQLPQILRSVGIRWVTGLQYTDCDKPYWRGLDGSTVYTGNLPQAGAGGGWRKYAPCPACRGRGRRDETECPVCGGDGLDKARAERDWALPELQFTAEQAPPASLMVVGGEELFPQASTAEFVHSPGSGFQAVWASEEDAAPWLQQELAGADCPPAEDLYHSVELNPNNTGCFVSRIRCKQTCRRQENRLQALLAADALKSWSTGCAPDKELKKIWEPLLFTMFHDAVTGTHVDAAYQELEEVWAQIDNACDGAQRRLLAAPSGSGATVINPLGAVFSGVCRIDGRPGEYLFTDVKPFSAVRYTEQQLEARRLGPAQTRRYEAGHSAAPVATILQKEQTVASALQAVQAEIENEYFAVSADQHGITRIWDKKAGRILAQQDGLRVAEWTLEKDEGSPWATLAPDEQPQGLADYTRLTACQTGGGFQRLCFETRPPQRTAGAIDGVGLRWSVSLYAGVRRVEFDAEVDWDCWQARLRMAVPVPLQGAHRYEIPFGSLVRQEYTPEHNSWYGANGDWPALNWAGVETPEYSVALLNRGTPSCRIARENEGTRIWVSVLRSPCLPTYLHEPEAYSMTGWDGMRDADRHHFSLALTAYDTSLTESCVVQDGLAYNGTLLFAADAPFCGQPLCLEGQGCITSVQAVEDGGLQVRVLETAGRAQQLALRIPADARCAWKTDALGTPLEKLPVEGQVCRVPVRAWEIATVRLSRKECDRP